MIYSKEQLDSKIRLAVIDIFICEGDQLANSIERIGFLKSEYSADSVARILIDSEMSKVRTECERLADLMIEKAREIGKEFFEENTEEELQEVWKEYRGSNHKD